MDDGSTDRTAEVVRQFKDVTLVSTENRGLSGAENHAFRFSQGDYIQYLNADDLLAPDKIERQLAAVHESGSRRVFVRLRGHRSTSDPPFTLRPQLTLARSFSRGMAFEKDDRKYPHAKRNLAGQPGGGEGGGPWDTRLHFDQDGEYFCRVLLASEGTRFVPGTGMDYRTSGGSR